jgi:hypothetical protein
MVWACNGVRKIRNKYKIFVGKPERKGHSEGLGLNGRMILKSNLRKLV